MRAPHRAFTYSNSVRKEIDTLEVEENKSASKLTLEKQQLLRVHCFLHVAMKNGGVIAIEPPKSVVASAKESSKKMKCALNRSVPLRGLQASESSCHLLWLSPLLSLIHRQDAYPRL